MQSFSVGDIVARKSYGADISFKIIDIQDKNRSTPRYLLRGLIYRILADSESNDLIKQDFRMVYSGMQRYYSSIEKKKMRKVYPGWITLLTRPRARPGKILHIDADVEFMDKCISYYRKQRISSIGLKEEEHLQPAMVRSALERHNPDILVLTGHDGIKKNTGDINSIENYRTSKYFIQSVKEARRFQPDYNKLCIFAGACQSYFEGIMAAGANFASSPGRVLINALDPAFVSERVATTDYRKLVTPGEIAEITISGRDGIGGIDTRGRLTWI